MRYDPATDDFTSPVGGRYQKGSYASQVDELTDDAIEDKAYLNIVGDKGGKVTGGRVSARANQRIENKASEIRNNLGIDEGAVISHPKEFSALGKSLDSQEKQIGAMGSYVKNMQVQVDRFTEVSEGFKTFDARIMNIPRRMWVEDVKGSAQAAIMNTLIEEVTNEIGKLAAGGTGSVQALSDSAREVWSKIHDKNLSLADMKLLLNEVKHLGDIRMDSVEQQRQETINKMRGLVQGNDTKAPTFSEYKAKMVERYPQHRDKTNSEWRAAFDKKFGG
jgi:hypothetical protein